MKIAAAASGDDCAVTDSATCLVQSVTEDGQENDWRNDTLEGEEMLDLVDIRRLYEMLR